MVRKLNNGIFTKQFKMKYWCVFALFFFSFSSFAQFAVINDKDGYVNIRSDSSKTSKIVGKIASGTVFYIFQYYENEKSEWIDFSCLEGSCKISGFVHKSRIKLLNQFSDIPLIHFSNNNFIFQKDSIKVTIKQSKFVPEENKIEIVEENQSEILKINGDPVYGTDHSFIPKLEYKSVEIEIEKRKISIPKKGLKNLFGLNSLQVYIQISYDKEKDILYIDSSNGDGAYSYDLLWIIEKGKYKNRFIDYGF